MNEKNKRLITVVVFATMPILTCLIMCLRYGISLGDIYIANSTWNDEALYYKLVESIVEYGQPLGFFGYNGSFAKIGHFGAWSPLILCFYAIYALIFGWTMMSPIYCNILLMTIAMIIFAWLVKPTKRQTVCICLLYVCNCIVTRYMLSVVTETAIYSLLLIFLAVSVKMWGQENKCNFSYVIMLNILACILVLMRPYWILLLIIPGYYMYRSLKKKSPIIIEFGVSVVVVIAYFWINRNLCAEYFTSIINFDWLKLLFTEPIDGIYNILHMFVSSIYEILQDVGDGVVNGAASGGAYAVYLVIMVYLVYMLTNVHKEKTRRIGLLYWLAYFVIMLLAIIYLYDVYVGSRHIMAFVFISVFVVALIETSTKRFLILLFAFIWLFNIRGTYDSMYTLPIYTEEKANVLQTGKNILQENMVLDAESDNAWDNTVIWVYRDVTSMDFTHLYALPAGVGINCCTKEYVSANFDALQARYIITNIGEDIDRLCTEKEKELIAEYGTVHIWKLR